MSLQLVRTDIHLTNPITLSLGIHEFGRGVFLDVTSTEYFNPSAAQCLHQAFTQQLISSKPRQILSERRKITDYCDDKRVSRCHGRLEVDKENKIILSALHKNPCFIKVKESAEIVVISQGMNKEISEGDKFGLLPDAYWYRLTKNEENHQDSDNEEAQENVTTCEDRTDANIENPDSPLLDFALNEDLDNYDIQASPSLLANEAQNDGTNTSANQVTNVTAEQSSSTDPTEQMSGELSTSTHLTKRLHSPDLPSDDSTSSAKQARPSDSLNIAEETPLKNIKEEKIDSQDQEDVKPGNLKVEDVKNEPKIKQDPDTPSCSNTTMNAALRERCMYGAKCYRRNPIHKQEFSHPGDTDWGQGDKAPCPWGSSCSRHDPRHWRDHTHPPGTSLPDPAAPRRPPGFNKRNKKKRVSSDEEDELLRRSGDEELAQLPAKRVRRTVKRVSWSGSESDNEYDLEDPLLTDGSDDWKPD